MRALMAAITLLAITSITQPASAHKHHRHHHYIKLHKQSLRLTHTPANIVTRETAMGPIQVSPGFGDLVVPLINNMVARGLHATQVHCWNHASTHVGHSNHYTGDACDFNRSKNRWAAMNNHRLSSLIHQHGLRDGCDFGDCGHVDNARNVGGMTRWNMVMSARRGHHHHRRTRLART